MVVGSMLETEIKFINACPRTSVVKQKNSKEMGVRMQMLLVVCNDEQ